jgi:hypothetical protein
MAITRCASQKVVENDNQDGWELVQDKKRAPWTTDRDGPDKVNVNSSDTHAWLELKTRLAGSSVGPFAPKEVMIDLLRNNPNGGSQSFHEVGDAPGAPDNIQVTMVANEKSGEFLRGGHYIVFKRVDESGNEQARVQNRHGAVVFTMTDTVEEPGVPGQWAAPVCPDGE